MWRRLAARGRARASWPPRRWSSAAAAARRPWGVVLDIDGVVQHGPTVLPGAVEALRMLRDAGVPYAFMSNGGGVTEAKKAKQLAERLRDDTIDETRVILAHTPMRALAERYRGRRVLIVGGKETPEVAASYGFDLQGFMAVTPSQLALGTSGLHVEPVTSADGLPPVDVNKDGIPIEAVLLVHDPVDWFLDLQVITDVLVGGFPVGSGRHGAGFPAPQAARVYNSNPDLLWQAAYAVPRYGQGAFLECLRALWRCRSQGGELEVKQYGKPTKPQFDAARLLIDAQYGGGGAKARRLYMIGDNPAADIRGANGAGPDWRSILLCTGVYQGGLNGNDATYPAWRVEADVRAAVEQLLRMSDEEHLVE